MTNTAVRINVVKEKTKQRKVFSSSRKLAEIKQLGNLSEAISNLYNRLDTDPEFFRQWRAACRGCQRRTLRRLFGQDIFNQYHGSIQCSRRRMRRPGTSVFRWYHCCFLFFWVDGYRISIDFCFREI